jgi:tetratricopeptide (TPR) repeat protein
VFLFSVRSATAALITALCCSAVPGLADNNEIESRYIERAERLIGDNKLRDALSIVDQLLRWRRDSARGFHVRGRICALAGQNEPALKAYSQAIALDPNLAAAYRSRATLLRLLGRSMEALADYDVLVKLDPRDLLSLRLRAFVRAETGDAAGAIADLKQAVRINPTSAVLHADLAKATRVLREASDVPPPPIEAISKPADVAVPAPAIVAARPDAEVAVAVPAIVAAQPAASSEPVSRPQESAPPIAVERRLTAAEKAAVAFFTRAQSEVQKGDYAHALKDYTDAVMVYPTYVEAYEGRAELKRSLGDVIGFEEDNRMAAEIRKRR